MFNQYGAQRARGGINPHRIGTVPIGTICYIMLHGRRRKVIVDAWLNRKYFPCSPPRPAVTYLRGGHLAVVRDLATGRSLRVADHYLIDPY